MTLFIFRHLIIVITDKNKTLQYRKVCIIRYKENVMELFNFLPVKVYYTG